MFLKRRTFLKTTVSGIGLGIVGVQSFAGAMPADDIKIGVVGLSVHSAAFSQLLNDPEKGDDLKGCRIVALYHPKGNPDVDFTTDQLSKFESDIRNMGVKIVSSMDEMLAMSDVVMIETNDGRPHLEEALPAFKAGKPVFLDKPVGSDLTHVLRIFETAQKYKVPIFTSSALRYVDNIAAINKSEVLSAFIFSPAALEKSHTDLYWYGIHGVELLYTVMGPGCESVVHVSHTDGEDVVIGTWKDGRTGTFRGIRKGRGGFGGTVFTTKDIQTLPTFTSYRSLVVAAVGFFKTKVPPVPLAETIEIYAFMEAAMESRKSGGGTVRIEETLKRARERKY